MNDNTTPMADETVQSEYALVEVTPVAVISGKASDGQLTIKPIAPGEAVRKSVDVSDKSAEDKSL